MALQSNCFQAFIVHHTHSSRARIRRITVYKSWVKLSALLILLVCLVALYGLYAMTQQVAQANLTRENARLRMENEQHRLQLTTLEQRIGIVEETSERIVKLSGVETNLNDAETNDSSQSSSEASRGNAGGPALPLDSEAVIDDVRARAVNLEQTLYSYEAQMRERLRTPSMLPVVGEVSDRFGARRDPFGGGVAEFHSGQDFSAPAGTPVAAAGSGTITFAGWQSGYGNLVTVDHGDGLQTRYAHLSRVAVTPNQSITRGEFIGEVGSTGRSTGPHLHYEVRLDERPVDPRRYLPHAQR